MCTCKKNNNNEPTKKDDTRLQTGVHGLDSLLGGGIPRGFVVIVTGPPGTGKTTLSMQFLIKGIK